VTDASRAKPIVPIQAVAAVFAVVFMFAWPGPWNLERWIGISIAVPAAFCLVLARYQLGASFSVSPQARELVTRGLYSKIRNPIYVFGGLMVLGFLLVLQIPQAFALFLVLVPMQLIRARRESRVLEAKFGEAYLEYKRNTWF
jgi:protein-S-isoprenylcysteine O-methyltransferase Ste14